MYVQDGVRMSSYIKIFADASVVVKPSGDEVELGYNGELDLVFTRGAAERLHGALADYLVRDGGSDEN
ncbi:hypothetical protein GCM10022243_58640 [Saccharothrix violaceirubra]|uniref:Uncharacterized protein n=1 Tax=Saccharothrix violaceirubra TaxID=413306 RepID=A0A7W7WVU0_9PSEU|nr:hypothetical protein [Saccharothrix violaceirubra]MBB4965704.1 hypothetical protein [Saccharothrix violaceirubra]